jgi:hypothetical protein
MAAWSVAEADTNLRGRGCHGCHHRSSGQNRCRRHSWGPVGAASVPRCQCSQALASTSSPYMSLHGACVSRHPSFLLHGGGGPPPHGSARECGILSRGKGKREWEEGLCGGGCVRDGVPWRWPRRSAGGVGRWWRKRWQRGGARSSKAVPHSAAVGTLRHRAPGDPAAAGDGR